MEINNERGDPAHVHTPVSSIHIITQLMSVFWIERDKRYSIKSQNEGRSK